MVAALIVIPILARWFKALLQGQHRSPKTWDVRFFLQSKLQNGMVNPLNYHQDPRV